MNALLPEGFAALEPFAARWAGETAAARAQLRDEASADDAAAFYAAAKLLTEPALDHLDARPLTDHDERERRLMCTILAFAHVAMGIEVQREDEPAHTAMRRHMRLTRAPADHEDQ